MEATTDESALLARLQRGDDAAYEELVRGHSPRMLMVARRFFADESDAHDAVQDAFVAAFRAIATFEGGSRLGTWLHRITVNACLMKLRSRRRRPERAIGELLPEFVTDGHQQRPAHPWRASADAVEDRELAQLVRARIDELPDGYREVLLLRDIEELSTEEAAEMLGLSVSAVKTRLHRARQALRELLDPVLGEG